MTAGFGETAPVGPGSGRGTDQPDGAGQPPLPDQPPRPSPLPTPPAAPTSAWPAYAPTSGFPPAYPPPAPRRRAGLAVLVGVLVLLVAARGAYLFYLHTQLAAANRKINSAAAANARTAGDLNRRIGALEQEAAQAMDVSAVSQAVLPSVFRIEVPEGTATAFAIGRPASGGTDLLTNYHVVSGIWKTGQRDAAIAHDNQRFTVHVARVDQNADLALLHADQKFTPVTPAPKPVQVGASVLLIGAPLGLTQSVTSGVVSAIRDDIPGDAGKTFIQFDAAINFGNSGGPVVNAQKQVVGIAAAKANGAEGIGLAIPISVACQSFSGIC
jgi:putative serine protease PepD